MRKFFTRDEVQEILDANPFGVKASYMDREHIGSPDNAIIYDRSITNLEPFADDSLHIIIVPLLVSHFHKKKLDSIEQLMIDNFGCVSTDYNVKQLDTDYYGTYYRFEIISDRNW